MKQWWECLKKLLIIEWLWSLGMGQATENKYSVFVNAEWKVCFSLVLQFYIFHFFISFYVYLALVFKNAKWLWLPWIVAADIVREFPESQLLEFLQSPKKDGAGQDGG